MNFILSILLGLVISVVSFHFKMLTAKGAVMTFLLAVMIFILGGWMWTVPILTFFILSSILSKFRKKINPGLGFIFKKGDVRDHIQVAANGGFPGIIILLNQFHTSELFYIAYVSAIAAACSDTWSTEIGTLINTKTFDIANLNQVEQGVSGGVSVLGFLGGILGAFTIALSAIPWLNLNYGLILIIIGSGFFASVFDSILGSTFQAKYNCAVCQKTIEKKWHCGQNSVHKEGIKWLDNDAVNFTANSFGGLLSFFLSNLIL
jgi:uncharacterized protein (TIGR00297 family)